ncbi:TPA: GPO family capsid scaffolding protein [Klebsiella pneumoniae]|uniref:GPO family capsid scaffolding protein n=1 Tax=Klebsiella pneumoniae TaxID=573 RepID=UPI000E2FD27A|nr:GPO family capsid scaffolding protein [Klebsiella pneumoniae]HBR1366650.1 GPO family capsid scaffolding protein [Klebsiella pneumoniae]HBR2015023.1 GPO family capsid scaffolding protein [Klebsiella pneumoniae]
MATAAKPARKKFRVAVSGATVDGREIRPEHLHDAAANYNPEVYGARVNVEHYLSPYPGSEFGAMGDVISLSAEDLTEGPLAGRTALYAEIEPSERMKQLTADNKKIYSSIELHPQFALNGKAYVMGLAMTDTPASLGTERLQFAAQQRAQVMSFNKQQGESPLFSDAFEAEVIELSARASDEGSQWFSRVMSIIGKGKKSDSEQFSQVRTAVEQVAQSHGDLLDRFNALEQQQEQDAATITRLNSDLTALREKLQAQDGDFSSRPAATGGNSNAVLADF